MPHTSVLLSEALTYLAPQQGKVYIDGTFGAGGHSRAILACPMSYVLAFDRDPAVVPYAHALQKEFGPRFRFFNARFSDIEEILAREDVSSIDGMLFDLGVSSLQLDTPERGFSFQKNGPLDMCMGNCAHSAAKVVNTFEESQIADILWILGEERKARAIARKIVEIRTQRPIQTTLALQKIVASVVKGSPGKNPATRTFQALRLFVNNELDELRAALICAEHLLPPGGRLVCLSFHSLEDRLVKMFLQGEVIEDLIYGGKTRITPFRAYPKKPIIPTQAEIGANPRARSAKMRVGIRQ
ncbi:MAG: 16S rRNA (cytosine(1402)-N(4))-methyltransferase RsmH [Holosporales bacterium]|jgi:16S rRNA (cytosine1402-N4)-methyltransferase|nr:16S rRNA (cytosine(1402)-N(4))-methyltransferase RsmH [Holosporales bacterium]